VLLPARGKGSMAEIASASNIQMEPTRPNDRAIVLPLRAAHLDS
jgi:hypothetical protein